MRLRPIRRVAAALAIAVVFPASAAARGVTEINLPAGTHPYSMVVGPDDALWFATTGASEIGRLTTGGQLTLYPTSSVTAGIALGSDGNLWFTEPSIHKVGRMTPAGAVTG